MHKSSLFKGDLEFLNDFASKTDTTYRQNRFLDSNFDAEVWMFRTGKSFLGPIDFRIPLEDGSLLTDHKHRDLLEIFKCWLCVHDHQNICGGRLNSAITARHKLQRTLHVIDYLILNAQKLGLSKHGLLGISKNDMLGFLIDLGSRHQVHESLYRWTERLSIFLRKSTESLNDDRVNNLLTKIPMLTTKSENESELNLDHYQLVRSRAWLWINGFYQRAPAESGYFMMPDVARLSRTVFAHTLYGHQKKPWHLELFIGEGDYGLREFPRAPVNSRSEEDIPTQNHIASYISVIRPLDLLANEGLKIPLDLINVLDDPVPGHYFTIKPPGRFRNLPQEVVLTSLRKSVEFLLSNGETIVSGYLKLMSDWKESKLPFGEFARSEDFINFVSYELRELGVSKWCLKPLPDGHQATMKHISPDLLFKGVRSNSGLYELLQVLYGSTLLIVGTLSARRSGELEDLPQNCLDKDGTRLVFHNRKSAEADMRERETRPIPSIGTYAIGLLQRIVIELKALKLLNDDPPLFCAPYRISGIPPTTQDKAFSETLLDNLCDYIETPLDEHGRRYYIRQHQLRRFFAMMFFWGGAFGGLDTLRWFLGHADIEHLWHYISESVPGAVLRNIKVEFAVGELLKDANDAVELANLLETHYGTRDFSILDVEELDQYVEELMIEGKVSVEPVFINTQEGKSYRIMILVANQKSSIL